MNWDTVQQAVRIILGWLGAYLVSKGLVNAENAATLTGGLLMVAQVGWWMFWNRKREA